MRTVSSAGEKRSSSTARMGTPTSLGLLQLQLERIEALTQGVSGLSLTQHGRETLRSRPRPPAAALVCVLLNRV